MQATGIERHDDVRLNAGNTGEGYAVEQIVRHKNERKETNYVVRWYAYKPDDDE